MYKNNIHFMHIVKIFTQILREYLWGKEGLVGIGRGGCGYSIG